MSSIFQKNPADSCISALKATSSIKYLNISQFIDSYFFDIRTIKIYGINLRQYRTMTARRLCVRLACIFSVSLHKFTLKYVSIPAPDLCKLTKKLTAQFTPNHCAVLPYKNLSRFCGAYLVICLRVTNRASRLILKTIIHIFIFYF